MRRIWLVMALSGLVMGVPRPAAVLAAGPAAGELIGTSAPIFSLASSHDRLAHYQADYYGSHHLILTFFPAAFTPV